MSSIPFIVFCIVQVLLFPIAAVGYVYFVGKGILQNRGSGISWTVLASFYTRWMQHRLRTRRDVPVVRLMRVLPNISRPGLEAVSAGTIWANRLIGYVPKIFRYPYPGEPEMGDQTAARTTYFDQALARHLGHIDQLVFLGAGFDTRSFRLPAGSRVRCFEVDQPKTQAFKREMLAKAGLDASHITFVPANFETDDWLEQLIAAGFDPKKQSFFLWEAVTPYLDQPAVENTLRKIATCAPGSVVAFDYFSSQLLTNRTVLWLYSRTVLRAIGEPFGTFGIDNTPPVKPRVAAFLASCGLTLEEQKNFGHETAGRGAPAGFAVGTVPFRSAD